MIDNQSKILQLTRLFEKKIRENGQFSPKTFYFCRFSPYILFVANLILKLIFRFQLRNSTAEPPHRFLQVPN